MGVKKWLLVLPFVAGCSLETDTQDDRPATLAFVTEAILKPSCATAECHSAMKAEKNLVFDSVDAARNTLLMPGRDLVHTCADENMPFPCGDAALDQSYLFQAIDTADHANNRMPFDQALSNKDIVLIANWIRADSPGLE